MIEQTFILKDYDWNVIVFYCNGSYNVPCINNTLLDIGCDYSSLLSFRHLMEQCNENEGFTYTNVVSRCSVVVIGPTTCAAEFADTYDHEKGHLARHIARYCNIDVDSEKYQYLAGEISKQMFVVAKDFLCDHCRDKLLRG